MEKSSFALTILVYAETKKDKIFCAADVCTIKDVAGKMLVAYLCVFCGANV